MLPNQADTPLIENTNIPVVYVDGPCSAEVHGHIVRITFFEFRREGGREVRVPVLTLVRPLESVQGLVIGMVREAVERQKVAALH